MDGEDDTAHLKLISAAFNKMRKQKTVSKVAIKKLVEHWEAMHNWEEEDLGGVLEGFVEGLVM